MYAKAWGSICNLKFNEKSAQVACKTMGYDDGKMVGNVNENGVCREFDGDNHCGPDDMPIHVKGVECVGNEPALKDCA
jgi:hypothetical protein